MGYDTYQLGGLYYIYFRVIQAAEEGEFNQTFNEQKRRSMARALDWLIINLPECVPGTKLATRLCDRTTSHILPLARNSGCRF